MSKRIYSERQELEVVALYEQDEYSLREIQEETGVVFGTAKNILARRGVKLRPRGSGRTMPPLHGNDLDRTVWLHRQGLTYEQMGQLLGLSEGGVKHRIGLARKRLGYEEVKRGRNNRPKTQIPLQVARAVRSWRELDAAV
jgi:DNA-directed RNA polymerase specialized sigma24 family protein